MNLANITESPNFVAFMAHMFGAFTVLIFFPHIYTIIALTIAAAVKEFWFDPKFETNPPQTIKDGWLDFGGYMAGIGLFFLKVLTLVH